MRTRHRAHAVFADIEGDDGGAARILRGGRLDDAAVGDDLVERDHAVRQIAAESADIADREGLGGGVHGQIGVVDAVDHLGRDDRAGTCAV